MKIQQPVVRNRDGALVRANLAEIIAIVEETLPHLDTKSQPCKCCGRDTYEHMGDFQAYRTLREWPAKLRTLIEKINA
jgi:hypothetical protein